MHIPQISNRILSGVPVRTRCGKVAGGHSIGELSMAGDGGGMTGSRSGRDPREWSRAESADVEKAPRVCPEGLEDQVPTPG